MRSTLARCAKSFALATVAPLLIAATGVAQTHPPLIADFDGDGKADIAVWRASTGTWFIIPSSNPSAPIVRQWGTVGDTPVPGDYDGDGKTDTAVWRPSTGTWFIIPSSNPSAPIVRQWGTAGDIPVPGDYDGDGKTDFAVWRPSTGTWFVIPSSNPSSPIIQQWGTNGDIPVPGDYDGDGKTDFTVWRPSNGTWYVIPSSAPTTFTVTQWGLNGDIPVPGDYDGDGKTDMAVWRPSNGTWYVIPSSAPVNYALTQWGISTDWPVREEPRILISILQSPSSASLLVGGTQQFNVTGNYSDGTTQDLTSLAMWNSSSQTVASVNATGLVTGTGLGNSTITATIGALNSNGAVIVTPLCATGSGSLTLGNNEDHILQLGQFGTEFTPDDHTTFLRQPDGSIRLWIAGGTVAGAGQTIGFVTDDFVNLSPMTLSGGNAVAGFGPSGPGTSNFDADYAGPGTIFRASNGTDLLMIYHAENHEFGGVHYQGSPFYASIGLARSSDNGTTWTSQGQIISSMVPKPSTYPARAALGAGLPSAILVGGYIYVYYVDWNLTYPDSIYVARAPVSSDGPPGSWQKYYNGSFSQPGLGGLSTAIQGQVPPGSTTIFAAFPDISYNTYLGSYLLFFETSTGWYYSTSPDLVTWTVQSQVFAFPNTNLQTGDTWYSYPTLISPEQNNDRITSCAGSLYYTKGVFNVTPQTMYRVPFSFQ